MLCRLAKTLYPSMPLDEYTPQGWALALDRERFEDAKEALRQLSREQQWLHVSDVVARVKKIRQDRVLAYGPLPDPPSGMSDEEYARWYAENIRAIADGTATREATPQLKGPTRDVAALGQVGRAVEGLHSDQAEKRAKARALDPDRTPPPPDYLAARAGLNTRRTT